MIELLTGKPPYSDLISMSALFRIVEDDCPPLPENISMVCNYLFIFLVGGGGGLFSKERYN